MPKPTPTQDENDRAALGEHVTEKEPDGSPPDPNAEEQKERDKKQAEREREIRERGGRRHATAGEGAPYQTRQSQPKPSQ
jgi:hypothetical protein